MTFEGLKKLARELAISLANETVFFGEENVSERTLSLLSEAREKLGLKEDFDEIDSLRIEK